MPLNKKQKIMIAMKILIPLAIVAVLFLCGVNAGVILFEPPEKSIEEEITTKVIINFGENITYSKEITLKNATVYDVLLELEKFGDIKIKATYWEQFDSYLIDSIIYKGIEYNSDTNHYWAYYINGEPAMEGANKVYVNNGDIIEWKYEKF